MKRPKASKGAPDRGAPTAHGPVGEADAAISYVWQTPARRPKRQPDSFASSGNGGGGLSPADRARLERIVSRAPEVMVKITGRTKGSDHLAAHLAYITRHGELSAETEEGIVLSGRQGLRDLQARWADDIALDRRRRADGTLSVNLILSMPPGTDSVKVRDAVRAFALDAFEGRHDYAFVLHQDEQHPHVHLTVRSLAHDGRRLNPRKADLHHWRERFAEELRLRGVDAEATPRRTRGRVRKAERGALRAIRERGVVPKVDRLAREAVIRQAREEAAQDRPWEARTVKRQSAIRARYEAVAQDLQMSTDANDRALAARIASFLETMPDLALRRHALLQNLTGFIREVGAERSAEGRTTQTRDGGAQRSDPER